MKRLKIITGAVLLSITAASLPLAVMYGLGRQRAIENQQRHLADYNAWTIQRARLTYNDAISTLREIEVQGWRDCSRAHIDAMRLDTFNHRSPAEVGFFANGRLACTSWGIVTQVVRQKPVDYRRKDGVGITANVKPLVSRGNPMLGLTYGSHNVLLDPGHMVDVLVDNEIALALANDHGKVLATLNSPPQDIVEYALAHPGVGSRGEYLFSSRTEDGWTAVAMEHRLYALQDFRHQRAILLPFALLIAGVIVAIGVWAMRRRLSPRAALEVAVRNREFVPFYQPILELATGRCVGAEALVRWFLPDGTMIGPDLFIPLAEQTKLIFPITDQLIERVIDDMHRLLRSDSTMHIAINLCSDDIATGRPLPLIARLLAEKGLPGECIWIEASERGFVKMGAARATFERAQAQGHAVAIDDFGTGYSNLNVLHSLPLDALKIDKSFVEAVGTGAATSSVIGHIIDMARSLDLAIVAEGIETEQQADYLRSRNVEYGQGWLYAKAMPFAEFSAFYREHASPKEVEMDSV